MLNFYRNIRKLALISGSMRKYISYAIGEIILVMLGILLALQVNNWNDKRNRQASEIKILQELKSDLESIFIEVEGDLKAHLEFFKGSLEFKKFLESDREYHDSLTPYFISSTYDLQIWPKKGAYENLKSIGFELISGDSLRHQITDFYELRITRLEKTAPMYDINRDIYKILVPYVKKHFKVDKKVDLGFRQFDFTDLKDSTRVNHLSPIDFKAMKNDNDFLIDISRTIDIRSLKIIRHQDTMKDIEKLIESIDRELLRF